MKPKPLQTPTELLVEAARSVARDALAQLPRDAQADMLARLSRDPLSGTTTPRVLVSLELSERSWSLSIKAGGSRPIEVAHDGGIEALPSKAAA